MYATWPSRLVCWIWWFPWFWIWMISMGIGYKFIMYSQGPPTHSLYPRGLPTHSLYPQGALGHGSFPWGLALHPHLGSGWQGPYYLEEGTYAQPLHSSEARDHYSTWPPLQPKENSLALEVKVGMAMVWIVDAKRLQANIVHRQNHVVAKKKN